MKKVAIIGSGSWGSSLAIHLARLGNEVRLWSFSEDEMNEINNERKCRYLPQAVMHENITATMSYKEAIEGSDFVLHVTPSKFTRENVKKYKEFITTQPVIICSKGFEFDTLYTLDEVVEEEMPNAKIAALSGPSHAEEVSQNIPTAVVIASNDEEVARELQEVFSSDCFRVYTSTDLYGVELGGSLKNIIALTCGIAIGLGFGDNSIAALITRGLLEISRLGVTTGANQETFYGLTGLGDLFVTCSSVHSRNRKCGILIGQGKSIDEAKKEVGMVVEGISALEGAYEMVKKYNVYAPIITEAYEVVKNGKSPQEATVTLITRGNKSEF